MIARHPSPRTRRALMLRLAFSGMTYRDALTSAASHDGVMREKYIQLAAMKCQRSTNGTWEGKLWRVRKDLAMVEAGR